MNAEDNKTDSAVESYLSSKGESIDSLYPSAHNTTDAGSGGGSNQFNNLFPKDPNLFIKGAKELTTPAAIVAGTVAAKRGFKEGVVPKILESAEDRAKEARIRMQAVERQRIAAEQAAMRARAMAEARKSPVFVEQAMERRFPAAPVDTGLLTPAHWSGEAGENYGGKYGVRPSESVLYPSPSTVQQKFIPKVERAAERSQALSPGTRPWKETELLLTPEQMAARASQISEENAPRTAADQARKNAETELRSRQQRLAASAETRAVQAGAAATQAGRESSSAASALERAEGKLEGLLEQRGWTPEMLAAARNLKYLLPFISGGVRGASAYFGVKDLAKAAELYGKEGISPETAVTGISGIGGLGVASGNPFAAEVGGALMLPKAGMDLMRTQSFRDYTTAGLPEVDPTTGKVLDVGGHPIY